MHILRLFDDNGGTLPVEIHEGVEYVVTAQVSVDDEVFNLFTRGTERVPGGVRYRGVGRRGVQLALARMLRDQALTDRYRMWLDDHFLSLHEEQQLQFLAVQDVVMSDARERVETALASGRRPDDEDLASLQTIYTDMLKTVSRLEALGAVKSIAGMLRDVVDGIDDGTLDVDQVIADDLARQKGFLPPGAPDTYGSFIEEFVYRLSRHDSGRMASYATPVEVVPASDLEDNSEATEPPSVEE